MGKHASDDKKDRLSSIKRITVTVVTVIYVLLSLTLSGAKANIANIEDESIALPVFKAELPISPTVEINPGTGENHYEWESAVAAEQDPVLMPLFKINEMYNQYGRMTIAGMTPQDYDNAMAIEWETVYTPGEPEQYSIDLSELMDYSKIENYILNLGRYDGVEISVIGKSEQGRDIYMVAISLGEKNEDKPLIMMTGSIHAREFAGAEYMVKFFNDTLMKAQADSYVKALLENITIVAVPLVNPDGREIIIEGGDPDRKSNANGVDLNRAMPSVNTGQLAAGVKQNENFSTQPGLYFFGGYNLGSESETQAMMKWMDYYVPKASVYIDLHQQGGVAFYNKGYVSKESDEQCKRFAKAINKLLKGGYKPAKEDTSCGLNGDGGTFTDYARSIAEGYKYSYSLGRMILDVDGKETPLLCFTDIDLMKEYYQPLNSNFESISIEIGRRPSYLGAGQKARLRREKEYNRYGWKNFLTGTIEYVLSKEGINEIKGVIKAE